MVRALEDSSWLLECCCPGWEGEKGDDVDEATDDARLPMFRAEDWGSEGKLEVAGE